MGHAILEQLPPGTAVVNKRPDHGLGNVQMVSDQAPDEGPWPVEHVGRDLFTTAGRQAVNEDGVSACSAHEVVVDAKVRELLPPLSGLILVTHRHSRVGEDRIGAVDCDTRLIADQDHLLRHGRNTIFVASRRSKSS